MARNSLKLGQSSPHSLRSDPPADTLTADFWPQGDSTGAPGTPGYHQDQTKGWTKVPVGIQVTTPKAFSSREEVLQALMRWCLSLHK